MSRIIEEYYKVANIMPFLLKNKLASFEKHPDIASEFEYWIVNKKYIENGISVEGYTAKDISKLSKYMDGEGAFVLLIELREKPEKAKSKIVSGFNLK